MDRDAYRVSLPARDRPFPVNPIRWVAVALLLGFVGGKIATYSGAKLLSLGLLSLFGAFVVFTIVKPYRALQLFLVLLLSGRAIQFGFTGVGTHLSGADIMVALLIVGWMLSERGMLGSRAPKMTATILVVIGMFIGFGLVGSFGNAPWVLAQQDLIPIMYLLIVFPLASALDGEREIRGIVLAFGVGLLVAIGGALYEYIHHFHDPVTANIGSAWGLLQLNQGFAGGPRVTPFGNGLYPAGMIAAILFARAPKEVRIPRWISVSLAALFGIGTLIVYTRSVLAPAALALVLALALTARDLRRFVASMAILAIFAGTILVSVPVLSGASPGSAVHALINRFSNESLAADRSYRGAETRAGLQTFAKHPIFGIGLGGLVTVEQYQFASGLEHRGPAAYFTNAYAGLLAKTGVVGTTAFVGLWILVMVQCLHVARRSDGLYRELLFGGAAWLGGLLVASYGVPFIVDSTGVTFLALMASFLSRIDLPEVEVAGAVTPEGGAAMSVSRSRSG